MAYLGLIYAKKTPSKISRLGTFKLRCLKGLSNEIYFAESGISRQVILKGRGAKVSEDFAYHLSCERPFKCWCHLVQGLGDDKLISNNCANLW
jgi:hypothetical protein